MPSKPRSPFPRCLAIAVVLTAAGTAQGPQFQTLERAHYLGAIPRGAANNSNLHTGDVDGDGDMDLVYFDNANGTVLRNDGHGAFTPGASFALPSGQHGEVLTDLDGDGKAELVSMANSVLEVRRFQLDAVTIDASLPLNGTVSTLVNSVVAGDFDEDGDVDVLALGATFFTPLGPTMFTNNGGTLVQAPTPFATPPGFAFACVGRVDADTHLDLVVLGGGSVWLYRGRGDGTFLPAFSIAAVGGTGGQDLGALVDLDGDNDLDFVFGVTLFLPATVRAVRNDGPNGFVLLPDPGFERTGIAGILDVDQDGRKEVLLQRFSSATRYAYARLGATTLEIVGTLPPQRSFTETMSAAAAIADFDGDLDEDIAGMGGILLLHRNGAEFGDGQVQNPSIAFATPQWARPDANGDFAVADAGVLSDGRNGVVEIARYPGPLPFPRGVTGSAMLRTTPRTMVISDGEQGYAVPEPFAGLTPPLPLQGVTAVAPLGTRAVFTCSTFASGLAIVNVTATGSAVDTALSNAIPAPHAATAGYTSVITADLDGDGILDIVHSLRALRGQADGSFVPMGDLLANDPGGVRDLAPIDFDGDQDLDLYVVRAGFDLLIENTGTGFVDATLGRLAPETLVGGNASAGDLDSDGDMDLFLAAGGGSPMRFLRNDGGRLLATALTATNPLALKDVDGDGDADLMTRTGIVRNLSRQLHAPRLPILGAPYPLELHARDLGNRGGLAAVLLGQPGTPLAIPGVVGRMHLDPQLTTTIALVPMQAGVQTFALSIPASPVLFGITFVAQAVTAVGNDAPRFGNAIREIVQ